MTRMQAEQMAREKTAREVNRAISYVAELVEGRSWGVAEFRGGKRIGLIAE